MDYKDIREIIAPCGLDCKKCVAYADGFIKDASVRLQNLLGNFDSYAVILLIPKSETFVASNDNNKFFQ